MNKLNNIWNRFAEKHPSASKWIREGGLFVIVSNLITVLKYVMLLFLPLAFAGLPNIDFGFPGIDITSVSYTHLDVYTRQDLDLISREVRCVEETLSIFQRIRIMQERWQQHMSVESRARVLQLVQSILQQTVRSCAAWQMILLWMKERSVRFIQPDSRLRLRKASQSPSCLLIMKRCV